VLFPSAKGEHLSVHGVQYLLTKHRMAAAEVCPSLNQKRVTVHRLRHTMAMDLSKLRHVLEDRDGGNAPANRTGYTIKR
jgi:site-specific recombinase XerD